MLKHRKATINKKNDKSESFHSLLSHNRTFFKDKIYTLRVINEIQSAREGMLVKVITISSNL
jgi:hypothetical protein